MPDAIEKEILRKLNDIGVKAPRAPSLKETTQEDLNALFTSLLSVYDTSWTSDTSNSKSSKHIRISLVRYLRILDLGHIIPSTDSLRPENPAVARCLSALMHKLEDKYEGRLQSRVHQILKPKMSRTKTATTLKVQKPVQMSVTPSRSHAANLPKTPGSAHLKLLNGQPLVPGSELRGRELMRSPPVGAAITPHVTRHSVRSATKRAATHSPGTPTRQSPRIKRTPLQNDKETKAPQNSARKCWNKHLEPKITDNVIPTGRQLGRTPPNSQVTLGEDSGDLKGTEKQSSGLSDKNLQSPTKSPDQVVTTLFFGKESDQQTSAESPEVQRKENKQANQGTAGVVGNDSIVIPNRRSGSTPVALACPDNLQCNENDLEFLQQQELFRKIRMLEKEHARLTKQLGEYGYKKDLLTAEVEEVTQDVTHVKVKIHDAAREVRRALVDHTNESPSVLPIKTKQTLLTQVGHKMVARATRLQTKLQEVQAAPEETSDPLNTTARLQVERDSLEKAIRRGLPDAVRRVEEELAAARQRMAEYEARRAAHSSPQSSSQSSSQHAQRTRQRLKVLRERIEIAKKRRALLKQMNLR